MSLKVSKSEFGYTFTEFNNIADNIDYKHLKYIDHNKALKETLTSSISRAKRNIIEVSMNNYFNYFITFTFDDNKIDAYQFEKTKKKVMQAIANYRKGYDKNLKYILIPELHKESGKIHFHGLMYLENTDDVKYLFYDKKYSRRVYRNMYFFKRFGANRFVKINKYNFYTALYIIKYVGKGFDNEHRLKQYYFISKGLKRSDCKTFSSNNISIEEFLGCEIDIIPNKSFNDFYCNIYYIDNESLAQRLIEKASCIQDAEELVGESSLKVNSPYRTVYEVENKKRIEDFI